MLACEAKISKSLHKLVDGTAREVIVDVSIDAFTFRDLNNRTFAVKYHGIFFPMFKKAKLMEKFIRFEH